MTEIAESRIFSFEPAQMRPFASAQSEGNALQVQAMNDLADNITESGGMCDEEAFLYAFYGQGRSYPRNSLPEDLSRALDQTDTLQLSAGEVYSHSSSPNGFAPVHYVGVILGISTDYEPTVISRNITKVGSGYYGSVSFLGLEFQDNDYGREIKPKIQRKEVIRAHRNEDRTRTELETYRFDELQFGIAAIRKAVRDNSRWVYDGMSKNIDKHIEIVRAAARDIEL